MKNIKLSLTLIILLSYMVIGCSSDGPESDPPADESGAMMTANIAGVQHDNMQPVLYDGTHATRVVLFSGTDENFLAIQGNSLPMNPWGGDSKEINLFIPESQWTPGTYLLTDIPAMDGAAQSNVNIIYNDSSLPTSQSNEEENGSITITKFDLQERVIEGTFEFRFRLYFVGTGTRSDIMEVRNGTFKYSLDDSFFD